MIKQVFLAAACIGMLSCNSETVTTEEPEQVKTQPVSMINALTEDEKKDGWELLFDGATTNGWHKYGGNPTGAGWMVKDSTLHLDPSVNAGGDIVTDNEYENFHLKLDWKVDTAGNSGIIIYIHEDSVKYEWGWETGPEMQVLDNQRHPDAKITKHRAGDLYDLISSSKETVKPALEWNHVEIKSLNGKLDLFLNGENVVSTTMWDDNWRTLIAGSKFKNMKDFGTYKKGRIGLQDHGNKVWFRDVKIKKL